MEQSDEELIHVYLEFNENLTPNVFSNSLFLRIANLQKPNPLVQINNLVFKGSYDECIGTNVFFEEIENPPARTNIFEKDTPIRLKPVVTQTKLIRLKQINLPRQVTCTKQSKNATNLNLNQDYQQILDKLEANVLNINDIEYKDPENEDLHFENVYFQSVNSQQEEGGPLESYAALLGDKTPSSALEAKYERLKRLARRPVKRIRSPERIAECEPEYKNAYEYHNLEKQFLQSSDAFRCDSLPIVEKNFIGGVDVERSALKGLIPPSSKLDRILSPEEQSKVFTIENLENLSIPARLLVVRKCITEIETLIANSTAEELNETDENSRTVQDFYEIFKKLAVALEHQIGENSERIQFAKCAESNEFISYTSKKRCDLLEEMDIFNENDWTDMEDSDKKSETQLEQESDSSADEGPDE